MLGALTYDYEFMKHFRLYYFFNHMFMGLLIAILYCQHYLTWKYNHALIILTIQYRWTTGVIFEVVCIFKKKKNQKRE